jgi:chromosome partitioning protein
LRSVALANQKGGVGKTTTAVHLAHGLALIGKRVALFDLDPQGNATVALQGMAPDDGAKSVPHVPESLRSVQEGLWLLPSAGAERTIGHVVDPDLETLWDLVGVLRENDFDWLIVDSPPRMDQWGWAGLQLCEEVMVPVQAEFFAIHGLSQMLRTLEEARAAFPGKAGLLGVLATIVDYREPVAREVVEDLRRTLGPLVMRTVIWRDSQLVEAASHGKTVFAYNPMAKASLSYGELVREVTYGGSKVG